MGLSGTPRKLPAQTRRRSWEQEMEGERPLSCKRCEFTPGVCVCGACCGPLECSAKGRSLPLKAPIKNITTL